MYVDVGGGEWCDDLWQQSPRGNKLDNTMNRIFIGPCLIVIVEE